MKKKPEVKRIHKKEKMKKIVAGAIAVILAFFMVLGAIAPLLSRFAS